MQEDLSFQGAGGSLDNRAGNCLNNSWSVFKEQINALYALEDVCVCGRGWLYLM